MQVSGKVHASAALAAEPIGPDSWSVSCGMEQNTLKPVVIYTDALDVQPVT